MAVITVTTDLDVLEKYNELVTQSLAGESTYIRTKETMEDLFKDGTMTSADKAAVISSVLGSLNTSVMSTSMQTALEWAKTEKELALKKLEMEKTLDILDKELDLKEAQADKVESDDLLAQASNLRQNGSATVVNGKVVALSDAGKIWTDMQLVEQNTENAEVEEGLLEAKVDETNAGIHKIVADTYVNYGAFNGYNITGTGITGISDITPVSYRTLSDLQAIIAEEQAKGYAYNAWSNAASGLGSTIGVALTTETDIFGTGTYPQLLTDWRQAITNLNNVQLPSF